MHSDHLFNTALKEMGRRNNIDISLVHGASVLTTEGKQEIWLEAPKGSAFVIIHTEIMDKVSFQKQPGFWEKCLTLNSNSAALKGGWLCKHEQTNTLRYCHTIPKKFADLAVLDEALTNIATASRDFEANLLSQRPTTAAELNRARL